MDHLAVMKRSWGLTEKILDGRKTIESRWYASKRAPWGRIKKGDTVYFKDSGQPVSVKAAVSGVMQFSGLTPSKVMEILDKYGEKDGVGGEKRFFYNFFKDKKYCVLVFLKKPERIKPFRINKTGFGSMSAWITMTDIGRIRKRS